MSEQAEQDMAVDASAGTEWIAKLRSGLRAAASRSSSSGVAFVSFSAGPGTPVAEHQRQQRPQQLVSGRPQDMACDEAAVEALKSRKARCRELLSRRTRVA